MVIRHPAKAGGVADDMLVCHPHRGRPHEGLVVETCREETLKDRIHRADIEFQRGEPVLAFGMEPVIEFDLGGPQVRFRPGAAADANKRVRLFRTGGDDAAWPVIFEGSADKMDIVRQQRRGKRVALESLIAFSVEGEGDGTGPVDASAAGSA